MLSMEEIYRLADKVEAEYAETVSGMVVEARKAIDKITECVRSEEFALSQRRIMFARSSEGCFTSKGWAIMKNLGYEEKSGFSYRIAIDSRPYSSVAEIIGWKAYPCLRNVLCAEERFRDRVCAINLIVESKQRIDSIRSACESLFCVGEDSVMSKIAKGVEETFNYVSEEDAKRDTAIYAMFNELPKARKISINVTISEE